MPGWSSVEFDNSEFFEKAKNQQIVFGNNNIVQNNSSFVKETMSKTVQDREENIGEILKPHFKRETPMTIGDIKKKILLDLAVSPTTVGLTTIGISLIIFYWAFNLTVIWPFLGFASILASVGIAITNLMLNLDTLTSQAVEKINEEKRIVRQQELDSLDQCLVVARGPQPERDQTFLRELRGLYDDFFQDLKDNKLSEFVNNETIDQIKELFDACVHSLSDSYDLWLSASKSRGEAKTKFMNEREAILDEVGKSVERFTETITGIRALNLKGKKSDLSQLRNQLNDSLEIARRTEQRMANINQIQEFE